MQRVALRTNLMSRSSRQGDPSMIEKPARSTQRFLIGIILGTALALIGLAVWMIVTNQGSPVLLAAGGTVMASVGAIIASKGKKKA